MDKKNNVKETSNKKICALMLFMGPPKHDASFTTWKHGKQQHVT